MQLNELNIHNPYPDDKKIADRLAQINLLINALREREIPESLANDLNKHLADLGALGGSPRVWQRTLRNSLHRMLNLVEKEIKLVPRHFYRTRWLAIGMTVFGVPLGVVFSTSIGNMGFIGTGIPIGMAIGIAIGINMDNKAKEEGRQLDLDYNF